MPLLTAPIPPAAIPTLARLGCVFLCVLWLLAGTLGHDLWKTDDAVHLNIAYGIAQGDWLVPRLAGESWLGSPPLFHWLAALCGELFNGFLPWHEGARLATVLFGGAFLSVLSIAAHRLSGANSALAAPLLAIGTLGLVAPLHEAQPIAASLAGWSLALLGLTRWRKSPLPSGALFGSGVGIGFLSVGLAGALLPLATGLLLVAHPRWRGRASLLAWSVALIVALSISLPWPWLLNQQAPELFNAWWTSELADQVPIGGFSHDHIELLAWASWPLLPLAVWNLWLDRRRLGHPQILLPLIGSSVALAAFLIGEAKPAALLPALAPLALLAANGAGRMRRGAANAFDWFGMMTFTLLAALIWLGGIAILTGEPQRVAKNFTIPAPDFGAQVSIPHIVIAIAASVGWIAVILRTPRSPWRAAARWSVGLTTVWVLLAALWLPWIDHVKTYRRISSNFHEELEKSSTKANRSANNRRASDCIGREGLGPGHRASLDYFDGIRTVAAPASESCRHLIVQTHPQTEKERSGWQLLLEASRPGDNTERLRLYRRS